MSYDHEHGPCERYADGIAREAEQAQAEVAALRERLARYEEALRAIRELGLCNGGSTRELEARCFLDAFKIACEALTAPTPAGPEPRREQ